MISNKEFSISVIAITVLIIVGGAYLVTNNKIDTKTKGQNQSQTSLANSPESVNNDTSCLKITSPLPGQTISFPLTVTGYIDISGGVAGTCTRWGAFEGEAGHAVVKDTNGNVRSDSVFINTIGDYTVGMQQWPVKAVIQRLTSTPYTTEVMIVLTNQIVGDGDVQQIKVIQPLVVQ